MIKLTLHQLGQLVAPTWVKGLLAGLAALLSWIYPDQTIYRLMVCSIALVCCDTVLGSWAAIVTPGEKFEAIKFRAVLSKFLVYTIVPAAVYWSIFVVGERFNFTDGATVVTAICYAFVIGTEMLSLFEKARILKAPMPDGVIRAFKSKVTMLDKADITDPQGNTVAKVETTTTVTVQPHGPQAPETPTAPATPGQQEGP